MLCAYTPLAAIVGTGVGVGEALALEDAVAVAVAAVLGRSDLSL